MRNWLAGSPQKLWQKRTFTKLPKPHFSFLSAKDDPSSVNVDDSYLHRDTFRECEENIYAKYDLVFSQENSF